MATNAPSSAAVLDRVRSLHRSPTPALGEVERTLTDGYACVLRTEGERHRLRGRLEERAAALGTDPAPDELVEITALAKAIARADDEIDELRAALHELAARARKLRVQPAY